MKPIKKLIFEQCSPHMNIGLTQSSIGIQGKRSYMTKSAASEFT